MATSVATLNKPLIDIAVPASGIERWAVLVCLALAGAVVLWMSARYSIPFYPVPMSMQTLAVMLIGAAFGWRLGLATVLLYLGVGAAGLPVFANTPQAGIGIQYMLGTTGGFLAGFAVAAAVIGWLVERGAARSVVTLFPAMLLGDALIFALGFAWLGGFAALSSGAQGIGYEAAWSAGVAPFLLGDVVKCAIAALLIPAAGKLIRR